MVAADLDHDGALDVGVIGGSRYEYYPGDGLGGFRPAVLVYQIPSAFVGTVDELAAGDIDANGRQEAIIAVSVLNPNTGAVLYGFAGFESTTLKLEYITGVPLVGSIDLCDLDGDGGVDLAQVRGGAIWLLRAIPDPEFGITFTGFGPGGGPTALTAPTAINSVRMRDFDANGTCDIVAGRQGGLSWWHGNGDGTFVTVNGISRIDRNIPDVKSIEVSLDAGDNMPDLFVSQGQPNGRLSWIENKSSN